MCQDMGGWRYQIFTDHESYRFFWVDEVNMGHWCDSDNACMQWNSIYARDATWQIKKRLLSYSQPMRASLPAKLCTQFEQRHSADGLMSDGSLYLCFNPSLKHKFKSRKVPTQSWPHYLGQFPATCVGTNLTSILAKIPKCRQGWNLKFLR